MEEIEGKVELAKNICSLGVVFSIVCPSILQMCITFTLPYKRSQQRDVRRGQADGHLSDSAAAELQRRKDPKETPPMD
eukprot:COSAG02_NODE_1492_length_12334_cov_29.721945_4_plen_78_part_00